MTTYPIREDDVEALRAHGFLVCYCRTPYPEHIAMFDAWQCWKCGRKCEAPS